MKSIRAMEFMPVRQWPMMGVALSALMVVGLAYQGWATWRLEQSMLAERQNVAAILDRTAQPAHARMSPADQARHASVVVMTSYLATPWSSWLDVLEGSVGPGVLLSRAEIDARRKNMKLSVRAKSSAEMMQFVQALQGDPRLDAVNLQRQTLTDADGIGPVEFELVANCRTMWADKAAPVVMAPSRGQP